MSVCGWSGRLPGRLRGVAVQRSIRAYRRASGIAWLRAHTVQILKDCHVLAVRQRHTPARLVIDPAHTTGNPLVRLKEAIPRPDLDRRWAPRAGAVHDAAGRHRGSRREASWTAPSTVPK
jgi:hypothetical protein